MPFIYNLSLHFIKITDSHSNAHFYIIIDESFESVSLYKKKKKKKSSIEYLLYHLNAPLLQTIAKN